ncbi:MAG: ABC transporter ATP-binding protein [Actinobacteria bacterium]|nr:ABC transporter ATP-binding protein [Actinomycetota bacterium]
MRGASRPGDGNESAGARRQASPRQRAGTLLEVRGMDVHYGKIQALRGVNLSIRPGEVVALLGANGAGKSSTLRAISGMVSPSAGAIVFDGEPIAGLKSHEVVRFGIAHVPEGRQLFPNLAVEENPQRQTGKHPKAALDRVYGLFPRLGERRAQAAGTMSGGEQQMLVFGRALMSSPRLLLVDEMSLGLAPLIVQILFDAVEQIHREGSSVILVEQFVHQALRHAQRAYVLGKGEVVLEAKSEKLRNDPNLLAAYLGGAEGHVEEAETPTTANGASKAKRVPKTAPAKKAGK